MGKRVYYCLLLIICFVVFAQSSVLCGEGGIDPQMADYCRESYNLDSHTRAMYNSITNNDINDLALNRDLIREHNDLFNHKIKTKGITNQKSTGRCWLFAGLNLMRPKVIKKYKLKEFEFSQPYLQFWDKMEKANCFLEEMIQFRDKDPLDREMEILLRNPIPDGGWWEYVVALIEKYGAIPIEIMPETKSSEKTGSMNKILSRKLRADAAKLRDMSGAGVTIEDLRHEKEKMLADVYRILAMNMGEPPKEFEWRYEDEDSTVSKARIFTPISFYKEYVGVDLKQYLSVFNDPTKEFGQKYKIGLSRNMFDGEDVDYANAEISVLKELALKSVLDDEPVWFACDVGKDQNSEHGIMAMDIYDYESIYDIDIGISKSDMVLYRESAPNHAMVFIGVDIKDEKPVKWMVENSWGKDKGDSGYWALYDSWFDSHVFNVILNKKYIPDDILAIYKKEPIILPPWDPMYSIIR